MGDRGQVHIRDTGVYLYTHWGATDLIDTVHRALSKRLRWDDDEYLTRIIFEEMTKGMCDRETGFGIGSKQHDDVWRIIHIDCEHETIQIDESPEMTFEQFISFKGKFD